MSSSTELGARRVATLVACLGLVAVGEAQELGSRWGTAERERAYYRIVDLRLPADTVIEAGAFAVLPDDRVAVGTRRGDIYLLNDVDADKPEPSFELGPAHNAA